jgi:hypothetical protein
MAADGEARDPRGDEEQSGRLGYRRCNREGLVRESFTTATDTVHVFDPLTRPTLLGDFYRAERTPAAFVALANEYGWLGFAELLRPPGAPGVVVGEVVRSWESELRVLSWAFELLGALQIGERDLLATWITADEGAAHFERSEERMVHVGGDGGDVAKLLQTRPHGFADDEASVHPLGQLFAEQNPRARKKRQPGPL